MSRYIDADELRRRVKEKTNPYGKPTLDYESGVKVLNMIDNAPTADVVEVRHGEWISESFISKTGEELYHTPMCSVCNQRTSFRTKFCPNCGAKMDRERKDNGT